MKTLQGKISLYINAAFVFAALVIILDLILPRSVVNDEVKSIAIERQQYFNAANNSHYSYKVITGEHQFSVDEEFARSVRAKDQIVYSISRIFKEVNWYKLPSSENRETYSLRIMTAIGVPLLMLISILVSYRIKKDISILVFVLQVIMIVDLIYLLI